MSRPDVEPEIVRLDRNVVPFLNEAAVRRALSDATPHDLATYPEPGTPRLQEAIARAVGVTVDRVLVGNGSDEILDLAMRALVPPGGRVGVLAPSFGMYDHVARAGGVTMSRVAARDVLPVAGLAALDVDAYFLASPNNPTGAAFPRDDVVALVDRVDVPVLIDEAYAEFARQDFRDLAGRAGRVIVTRTFSKAYGLPGIRVGYALGPPDRIGRMASIRMPYNLSAWSERAALAALEDGSFVDRAVRDIESRRPVLVAALVDQGWPVWPSGANFLLVGPIARSAEVRETLRRRGVLVKPIDYPGGDAGGCLRITVGTDAQHARLLEALKEAAQWRT
ncbi:MAG: pyridoxal phosphate-dependent aminotransferase [Methanobacteriota archaeon]